MKGSNDANELNDTWQTLAAPTARILENANYCGGSEHQQPQQEEQGSEKNREKDAGAEFEMIQAQLRFIDLIREALRRPNEKE